MRCKDYSTDLCWYSCSRRSFGCALRYWKGKRKKEVNVVEEMDKMERRESLEEGRETKP